MYEPIRSKSVHFTADAVGPQRSRAEELDIRLAGHLTALLTVTDELRALVSSAELDDAAQQLAGAVARLRDGRTPLRAAPSVRNDHPSHVASLHQRAHSLAGQALVIADSRADEDAAALATARMEAHAAALGLTAA
ncbi:hypothetical protein [Streptomyces sp. NPDC005336]|uniref:SCO4983 family protein n=1 Tax=Streptomyces sp. NPDC005336 TaxID=3157035 RepID=UPI00339F76EB